MSWSNLNAMDWRFNCFFAIYFLFSVFRLISIFLFLLLNFSNLNQLTVEYYILAVADSPCPVLWRSHASYMPNNLIYCFCIFFITISSNVSICNFRYLNIVMFVYSHELSLAECYCFITQTCAMLIFIHNYAIFLYSSVYLSIYS